MVVKKKRVPGSKRVRLDAEPESHEELSDEVIALRFDADQLRIDPEQIESELTRHPGMLVNVSHEKALAISRRDKAKDDLKRLYAALYCATKKEQSGSEKLIESLVIQLPAYVRAQADLRQKEYLANAWEGLRDAYQARGYMLRDLANMHVFSHGAPDSDNINSIRESVASKRDAKRKKV